MRYNLILNICRKEEVSEVKLSAFIRLLTVQTVLLSFCYSYHNFNCVGVVYNLGSYILHISHVVAAKNDKFGSLSSRSCFKARMILSCSLMVNETFQLNHLTVHCDSLRAWVPCNDYAIFLGINIRIHPHFKPYVLEVANAIHLHTSP